jgi:broad specificity phosphatase PhoE
MFYSDPELTKLGIEKSKAANAALMKRLETVWAKEPYVVASSQMIRAQETAYYMISSETDKPINIFPFISEKGITRDNYAMPRSNQIDILNERNPHIVDLLTKGSDNREPQSIWTKSDLASFIKWASHNSNEFSLGSDGHYRAVIFTHSHFLKESFHMGEKVNNNDALHTIIDTTKPINDLKYDYWQLNTGSEISMCPNGCRVSTCKKVGSSRRKRGTKKRKLVHA